MAYDKTTDPFRVSEQHARRRLDREAAENGFLDAPGVRLVDTFRFHPGGAGEYASFDAICRRDDAPFADRPYSVHTAVLISEADGVQGARLTSGTYDLTLEQAQKKVSR